MGYYPDAELEAELARYVNRGHGRWRYGWSPSGERWAMAPGVGISVGGDDALRLRIGPVSFVFDWDGRTNREH